MASTQKAKIPVGFVIAGKYRITGELGRGGMAAVYEAENVDIGKRVAIKVLAQELISSTVVVERFLREARAVAAIRSPYICDVYDSGRLEDGRPFLVLELLEGESLYERMVRVGPIDVETTVTVMAQTCRGLTRAHAAGIVHRDLKPENIFVTKDEEGELLAKILDFGLAKFYQPVEEGAAPARLTRDGAVFGTPAYMSPEQVRGQGAVDARADLWALGCITYECLTGRTVWSTDQGVAMTFAQIAQCQLPDPMTFRPDLPDTFRPWFQKSLHKDIAQRFQTPKEFAEELMTACNVAAQSSRGSEHSQDLMFAVRNGDSSIISPRERSSRNDRTATRPSMGGTPSGGIAPTPIAHETSPSGGAQKEQTEAAKEQKGGGAGKFLLSLGVIAALTAGGYYGYRTLVPPSKATNSTASGSASVSGTPAPVTSGSGSLSSEPVFHDTGLPWRPIVAQAQEMIAKGDYEGARSKLKEAQEKSSHHVPASLSSHLETVLKFSKPESACKLTGLGRPRSYDVFEEKVAKHTFVASSAIAVGIGGPIIAWTENDPDGTGHGRAVTLDESLRAKTKAIDVTPEAKSARDLRVWPQGDRFLVTYEDARPPDAGVYARYLDKDGNIASNQVAITKGNGASSATAVMLPDKTLLFVWVETSEKAADDIYARKFTAELQPVGEKIRMTALAPSVPSKPRAKAPEAAVDKDSIHVTFRLGEPEHVLMHFRVPFATLSEVHVTAEGMNTKSLDRYAGPNLALSPSKMRVPDSQLVCTPETCFAAWSPEGVDGVLDAVLKNGQKMFHKEIVKAGKQPGIGYNAKGGVQAFWYERSGKIMTGPVPATADPVPGSVVGRIQNYTGPAPNVSAGVKDREWYAAFSDSEGNVPELFVVRVECK